MKKEVFYFSIERTVISITAIPTPACHFPLPSRVIFPNANVACATWSSLPTIPSIREEGGGQRINVPRRVSSRQTRRSTPLWRVFFHRTHQRLSSQIRLFISRLISPLSRPLFDARCLALSQFFLISHAFPAPPTVATFSVFGRRLRLFEWISGLPAERKSSTDHF